MFSLLRPLSCLQVFGGDYYVSVDPGQSVTPAHGKVNVKGFKAKHGCRTVQDLVPFKVW